MMASFEEIMKDVEKTLKDTNNKEGLRRLENLKKKLGGKFNSEMEKISDQIYEESNAFRDFLIDATGNYLKDLMKKKIPTEPMMSAIALVALPQFAASTCIAALGASSVSKSGHIKLDSQEKIMFFSKFIDQFDRQLEFMFQKMNGVNINEGDKK